MDETWFSLFSNANGRQIYKLVHSGLSHIAQIIKIVECRLKGVQADAKPKDALRIPDDGE